MEDYRVRHAGSKALRTADSLIGTDKDIYALVEKIWRKKEMPRMFQACGTKNFTWDINEKMRDFFYAKNMDLTWEQETGIHCRGFWSIYIEKSAWQLILSIANLCRSHKFESQGRI